MVLASAHGATLAKNVELTCADANVASASYASVRTAVGKSPLTSLRKLAPLGG